MHYQQTTLARENQGLVEIEQYANAALPEDYEIDEVLDDVIMAEYADVSVSGKEIKRNGIFIPEAIADQKAWRVGKVIISGPSVKSERLRTAGTHFIFPGDRGIRSLIRGGKQIIFINEARIFGVCSPLPEAKQLIEEKTTKTAEGKHTCKGDCKKKKNAK